MQAAAGAGRIPVDLENEHDSLTCVFPFMEGFRVRVIAALRSTFTKFVSARKDGQGTSYRTAEITPVDFSEQNDSHFVKGEVGYNLSCSLCNVF